MVDSLVIKFPKHTEDKITIGGVGSDVINPTPPGEKKKKTNNIVPTPSQVGALVRTQTEPEKFPTNNPNSTLSLSLSLSSPRHSRALPAVILKLLSLSLSQLHFLPFL